MHKKFRIAGWLAVSGLLAAAVLAPASVFATDLHAAHQNTAWDAEGFQSNDCVTDPGPGQVVWHFVLTTPNATSGHLTATFQNAGTKTVANLDLPSTTLHFEIVTGHDTLLDAETTDVDGGNLNLSHICVGTEKSTPSAPVETASVPAETASVPAETASVPAETASVPAETASVPAETASVPAETASVPAETASVPAETASVPAETASVPAETASVPAETASVPAETASVPVESSSPTESLVINPQCPNCPPDASPSGKVDAATGTPHEGVTPPATDTLTASGTASNDGWQLVLVALAALLATVLILTPSSRKNRR
jgi:hypothetical protein